MSSMRFLVERCRYKRQIEGFKKREARIQFRTVGGLVVQVESFEQNEPVRSKGADERGQGTGITGRSVWETVS